MDTEEVVYKKPPLGLVPRFVVVERRAAEILLDEPHWKTIEGVEDANKKKRR